MELSSLRSELVAWKDLGTLCIFAAHCIPLVMSSIIKEKSK